ncbi:HNH endonuclease signature motif containing protein [Flavisphingomonas formosensis]|uniref:HNH endonuclease signature motif containing protein n=1 Tax=Flavisphingomonas formosensis TaxID=861534 RepID=UPI0038CD46BA
MPKHRSMAQDEVRGGIARSRAMRAAYFANPPLCNHCNGPIGLSGKDRPADGRKKKFCSRSCAASFNNCLPKRARAVVPCRTCGANVNEGIRGVSFSGRAYCKGCWSNRRGLLGRREKSECSHSVIRAHARSTISRSPKRCMICGYDRHAEACHLRPVAAFPGTARLDEINSSTNLVWLCPNHHWELDHGMLAFERLLDERS